ncbi:hypothetical protein [Burkholderia cenocepacia]|uniref:hypothetical protein n=1 Tax=Burkholderia cenocepacia TaxID=95486 RepID=UPI002ABDDA1C|nr:hypothetical protein [Burkholderia cenocepacia]
MATNDFLVFGGGSSPNVIDQATYAALSARLSGFQSGTALSAQLNKVWRQSSIMAAVLAQFTANFSGQNSVDDGSTATLLANLQAAINAAGITAPQFDSSTKLATTSFLQRALGNYRTARGYAGNATLSAVDIGAMITWDGNGTLTLPDATAFPGGSAIRVFKYAGPIASVLAANKAGQMTVPGIAVDTYTFPVGVSGFFELINESSAKWDVAGELFNLYGTTAAAGDNSSKVATTAFVKQAGESYSSIQGIATTASLNGGHVGAFIWAYGSGITLTLPPVAGVPNGATITIGTPVGMTVKGNASETINNQFGVTSNTLALNAGEQAQFVSNGGAWYLASYTTVLGTTPAAGDNSTKLATTAFVQRAVGSVVGSMRNASMSVPTVSASATFTADEIVVETALGGAAFRIANFNATINLGTTGAGGMDTGTAPASGFVAVYTIYNPTNGAAALLATNATASVAPNVYSGANMPAGYTASALVSVWSTNSSRQFGVGFQVDRTVNLTSFSVLSTSVQQSSYTPFSVASYIPPNAKLVSGYTNCGSTAASIIGSGVSGSSTGIGSAGTNGQSILTLGAPFSDVPMVTPQTMFYVATASAGTMTFSCFISSYKF